MKRLLFLILCVMPLVGYAEKYNLSLTEARDMALQQNRTLQNASLDVQMAYAQRWQTIAAMLPQVDGSIGLTSMCGYKMNFEGMSITMPDYMSFSVQAAVGLNGQAIVGALLNNLAIEMQELNYEQKESTLLNQVMTTYASVLVMQDIQVLLDSSLTNVQTLADMTQKTVEIGVTEQTTADQLLVRVNALKNNINSAKRNLELAKNSLKVLLGLSAEDEIALSDNLESILSPEQILTLLGDNFNINDNLNYQLLQKNVELSDKQLLMSYMAYVPTLAVFYQYSYQKYFDEGGFCMTPPNTVGLTLSVPIWSSGKRAAGITEKKIARQEAQNTLDEMTDNLYIQHQQLCFNLTNAYETYINEKDNIDVTQRVFASTTNKFKHGAASNLELTNASNDMISAQSTYVQAVLTLVQAEAELVKFLNKK